MQARWDQFKALTVDQQRNASTLEKLCGVISQTTKCTTLVGRPKDAEIENCDKICCYQGHLTGRCDKDFSFTITATLQTLMNQAPKLGFVPKVAQYCKCSDDWKDAFCGADGRFLKISCPFDRSACARACCRSGKTGGKCKGFLRTKCKCD